MALIIYAEDDKLIACVVRNILGSAGHMVGVVEDGKSALLSIKVKQPALVMLDCSLPAMSGIEVLRQIRLTPTLCNLPVLMLTGRQSDKDVSLAAYAGADGYVKKPFDPDYLVFAAENLIHGGRSAGDMSH